MRNGIPTIVVASYFEKDPQVMLTHKANTKLRHLVNAPQILVSKDGQFSYWQWMVKARGSRTNSCGPYGYNLAEYLTDKKMVQQAMARQSRSMPRPQGLIRMVPAGRSGLEHLFHHDRSPHRDGRNQPDLVHASSMPQPSAGIITCTTTTASAMRPSSRTTPSRPLKKLNEEVAQMKALGIIAPAIRPRSELAPSIWRAFRHSTIWRSRSGILEAGSVDIAKVATDKFVNKKVGMDLLPK